MWSNSVLSFCVNSHTKQSFLFYLSWVDWGNAKHFPACCLSASPPVLQNSALRGPCDRVTPEKAHFSFHCMVVAVSRRTFTSWYHPEISSEYSASHELQRQKCKLVLLHHAGGWRFGFVLWKKAFWFLKDFSLTRQGLRISVSLAKGASPIWTEFFSDELFTKLQSESLLILSKITIGCFSLSCCY